MTTDAQKLDALKQYQAEEKFGEAAWAERGLNPSPPELCKKLESAFNLLADQLYVALGTGFSGKLLKEIMNNSLKKFDPLEFDTEERELIADNFHTLSDIVSVNLGTQLNKWLYGDAVSNFMKLYEERYGLNGINPMPDDNSDLK